jgi:diadenylate cyclase
VSELSFILSSLDFASVIDILLVALTFFLVLRLIQGTQAVQVLRGVLIISVLVVIAASALNTLTAFSWLVGKALPALLVSIPIIFQPELRRALERLGRTSKLLASPRQHTNTEAAIEIVSRAAVLLAQVQHGALIVFERDTGLGDYVETGVGLNAVLSPDLLVTIFYPGTILHDGGVIISGNRLLAAAIVFPLGGGRSASRSMLGTRHRAALGITETTDAIAVVISEETGLISVAHDGHLIRGLDKKRLEQLLRAFFKSHITREKPERFRLGQSLLRRLGIVKSGEPAIQAQSQTKQ